MPSFWPLMTGSCRADGTATGPIITHHNRRGSLIPVAGEAMHGHMSGRIIDRVRTFIGGEGNGEAADAEEDRGGRLYECRECGITFIREDERPCPECGRDVERIPNERELGLV